MNQKVIQRILKNLGLEDIEIVDNGQRAIEAEKAQPYDIVLMDMQMPIVGGLEACRAINARKGGHPLAKVVFVTAHVSSSFRELCLENGAVDYLPKPCHIDDVRKCLERVCSRFSM